MKESRMY